MSPSTLAVSSNRSHKAIGDAYLKFQLAPNTSAIFSMKSVQEAVVLPVSRMTAMPNTPDCMLGLMNRRSRVLWVVSLANFLGLSPPEIAGRQYNLIIVRIGNVPLGLVVHHIHGIVWLASDMIQPPPGSTPPGLLPYLQGCVLQAEELVLALDAEAIVQSPFLRNL